MKKRNSNFLSALTLTLSVTGALIPAVASACLEVGISRSQGTGAGVLRVFSTARAEFAIDSIDSRRDAMTFATMTAKAQLGRFLEGRKKNLELRGIVQSLTCEVGTFVYVTVEATTINQSAAKRLKKMVEDSVGRVP